MRIIWKNFYLTILVKTGHFLNTRLLHTILFHINIMKNHTKLEKAHYDLKANAPPPSVFVDKLFYYPEHKYFEKKVWDFIKNHNEGGTILDYGCGTGSKSRKFSSSKWKIFGIDISSTLIELANKHAQGVYKKYMVMNCEDMSFADNKFDLIFDYGTFSSLDMRKAFPEILRLLKPTGSLIAIETLGHNPLANLKRNINVVRGKRTKWAAEHIMKMSDWNHFKRCFESFEIKYFGLLTLFVVPLVRIIPNKFRELILHLFQIIDCKLLQFPTFQKFAFKTVVVLSNPKKK